MLRVIVFDDGKGQLSPLTDFRPAFDVRTGAMTTLKRLRLTLGVRPTFLRVPDALRDVTRQRSTEPVNTPISPGAPVLLYNGRCVLPPSGLAQLAPGTILAEATSNDIIAACLAPDAAERVLKGERPTTGVTLVPGTSLLSRPWHVRTFRDRAITLDLQLLMNQPKDDDSDLHAPGSALFESAPEQSRGSRAKGPEPIVIGGGGLSIHPTARVYPGVTLDTESGPIYIAEHAVIRPGAILIGPCYIGPNSWVLERATIRPQTAIGPWCKVNGEIGGTIFQGFSNKAHDGYLGDSWVGEWVNFGAGTTNSNLLNTYAEIIARAAVNEKNDRTGETFLGAIVGDHVKFAICTRIMTGSVLHTGGMFACSRPVSGTTRPFAWVTDDGERTYRPDKFLDVARAMMSRRKVTPTEAYIARLSALHAGAQ